MDAKEVLENFKRQHEQDCSQDQSYYALKAYCDGLEEIVEELKKVIWRAYGEATNGRFVDRWMRVKEELENALEEYGEPDNL